MKKSVAFLLLIAVMLAGTSCRSNGSGDGTVAGTTAATEPVSEASAEPVFENFAVQCAERAVSDGEYVYFVVRANDTAYSSVSDIDGLYRADLSLQNPVRLARGRCGSLAMDEENVYFVLEDRTNETWICAVDKQGGALRRLMQRSAYSLGIHGGRLFYIVNGSLYFLQDGENGEAEGFKPPDTEGVIRAQAASDGGIWLYTRDNGSRRSLYLYDPASGAAANVASIDSDFAVVGDTVYSLMLLPGQDDTQSETQDESLIGLALMKTDQSGAQVPTGVTGRFAGGLYGAQLFAYGPYLFYTKYTEVSEIGGKGPVTMKKVFCYDTLTGTETRTNPTAFIGETVYIKGVAGGRLYYKNCFYSYETDYPDFSDYDLGSYDLVGEGEETDLKELAESAVDSDAVKADDLVVQARMEELEREREQRRQEAEQRQREEEEAIRNAPYGPGTSKLFLKSDNRSACFRLVRMDGTTEFRVLLQPGYHITKSFPCGYYILKVARGETWISDEEAFGENGSYSTTEVFLFEEDQTYEITSGPTGSFRGDSREGFTG